MVSEIVERRKRTATGARSGSGKRARSVGGKRAGSGSGKRAGSVGGKRARSVGGKRAGSVGGKRAGSGGGGGGGRPLVKGLKDIKPVIDTMTHVLSTPDQSKIARQVNTTCEIRPSVVRKLGVYMGIPLQHLREKGPNNVCHALGIGMSMLFQTAGQRQPPTFAYPIKTAGSGITALSFFMSDGSIIKVVKFHKDRRQKGRRRRGSHAFLSAYMASRTRKTYQSGFKSGAYSTPMSEFVHEIVMTKKAHRKFKNTPDVPKAIILRGKTGVLLGIMQQTRAPGVELAAEMDRRGVGLGTKLRLARAHGAQVARTHVADFSHGDMHSGNIMVRLTPQDQPKFTMIDFGRATTKKQVLEAWKGKGLSVWHTILLFDVVHPYRNHMRDSRIVADTFLAGYVSYLKLHDPKMRIPRPPIADVRSNYDKLTFATINAVLDSVSKIANTRVRKHKHKLVVVEEKKRKG
jgi:hypothetical protein